MKCDERVFIHELARYLRFPIRLMRLQAKRLNLLEYQPKDVNWRPYVSPYAAQRLIAYARAVQGEHYLCRKNYFRTRAKWRTEIAARKARNKMSALSPLTPTCVQTEAEGQR